MGSSSRPTTTTSQVRQEYPAFFKPHLERVLQGAESEFGRDYIPFPEGRLVETPAARAEALTALQAPELTDFSQPMFETALAGTAEAAKTFPETDLEAYMNPYQQLVTDQLLRKAGERRGIERKGISDAAARAGAFGGGRHGITEGLFDQGTQEQLQDIQDRSDMANFQNALAASQTDKTRGLQAALQTSQLGEGQRKALIEGQIGREKAATAEQALDQQIRDVGYQEFQEQLGFPQQKLAEYSSIIRGHTPPPDMWKTQTQQTPVSGLQQAAGLGSLIAGVSGFGKKEGGVIRRVSGGEIDEEGNIIAGGYGDYEAGVIDAVSETPITRSGDGDSGLSTIPVSRADTMDRHDFQSLADIENQKSIRDALQADSAMSGKGWSEALRDYLKGQVGEDSPERHYDMSHTRRGEPITIGPYPTGNEFIHGPGDKNPGTPPNPPAAYPYPPSTPAPERDWTQEQMGGLGATRGAMTPEGSIPMTPEGSILGGGLQGGLPPSQRATPTPPVSGLLPPSQREVLDRDQRWKDKFLNVKKGGPIKFGHGGSEGSAEVQVYIDKLSELADQLALNTEPSYTNKGQARQVIRDDALEFERQMNPNSPIVPDDIGPGIDLDQLRELERSRTNTLVEAPSGSGGLQTLAYGGVPGQAYTEDIGMMGGLGAVAGPQLRFQGGGLIPHDQFVNSWMTPKVAMAYGGVPGQAYTEDIGMMGGLGAVAGPQLRFQNTGAVPPIDERPELFQFFSLESPSKRYATPESEAFAKKAKERRKTTSTGLYGLGNEQAMKRAEAQREAAALNRQKIANFFGLASPSEAEATREEFSEKIKEIGGDVPGESSLGGLSEIKEIGMAKDSPEEIAAQMDLADKDLEESEDWAAELEREDREHGETGRSLMGDIQTKADDPPKVKKEKEKKQKEKWGPNWKLVGVGMQLLRGDKAGLDAAAKMVEDMPTEGDKEMAQLKKEYLKAKTESAKSEASNKLLKMWWDREHKNTELGVKVNQLALNVEKANWAVVGTLLKGMSETEKMMTMGLTEEESDIIEENPERAAEIIGRKKIKQLNVLQKLARGQNPYPVKEKEPEEEEEEFKWTDMSTWFDKGGAVPDSLRDVGVTSIRKI